MSKDRRKSKSKSDRRRKNVGSPHGNERRQGDRRAKQARNMAIFYLLIWFLVLVVPAGGAGAYFYMNKDSECHLLKPITAQVRLQGPVFCQKVTQKRAAEFQSKGEDWGFLYIDSKCLGGKVVHECKRYRENSTF
jgi:hypothetical protein